MSDPLPPDIVQALAEPGMAPRLGEWADRLSYYETVPSTSDVAVGLVHSGALEGSSVVATHQTAGRGRRGRHWFSPRGAGLYLSVVLDDFESPTVTLLAGVATAEAIRSVSAVPVELEWPNDLVMPPTAPASRSHRAKVGGILTEAVAGPDGVMRVVVGVGVNLVATDFSSLDREVTALNVHAATAVDRGTLLVETLCQLAAWRNRCRASGLEPMLDRWTVLSPSSVGAKVGWDAPHGRRSGVTAGIAADGALRVHTGEGIETIVGGTLDW